MVDLPHPRFGRPGPGQNGYDGGPVIRDSTSSKCILLRVQRLELGLRQASAPPLLLSFHS
jgi:hypothetical protein